MWFNTWFRGHSSQAKSRRVSTLSKTRSRRVRPRLEQLEDRTALSNFNAFTVADLIADINAANKAGGANTITLTASTTSPYVLTAVDNTTDGANGLPVIKKGDTLTIVGNGDTIERSTASGTPDFRLLDVAFGASLTLQTVTLQYGLEDGSGNSAEGGGIYDQGTLVLSGATVQNNEAQGSNGANAKIPQKDGGAGQDAAGGGIWSNGTLTLENGTLVQNNFAVGGNGGDASGVVPSQGGNGGSGSGGGVYVAGGTATLVGGSLSGNFAEGGVGGHGDSDFGRIVNLGTDGSAFGGGLDIAAGTVQLTSVTVDSNVVGTSGTLFYEPSGSYSGGGIYIGSASTVTLCNDTVESNAASNSLGFGGVGGGIYIASGATVYIDSLTVAHTINNSDSGGATSSTANIDGTYILQNC
jgi:hypothetical protein